MIVAIKDMVWCTPIFDPDKIGSLYIPDIAKERVDQGLVKYVGPDVQDVEIGDYVVFPNYGGTLLKVDGETVIGLRERFISAIIDISNQSFDIPGLFFRDREGTYFPATYEFVFTLLSMAITENNITVPIRYSKNKALTQVDTRPDDYDEMNPYVSDKEIKKVRKMRSLDIENSRK